MTYDFSTGRELSDVMDDLTRRSDEIYEELGAVRDRGLKMHVEADEDDTAASQWHLINVLIDTAQRHVEAVRTDLRQIKAQAGVLPD